MEEEEKKAGGEESGGVNANSPCGFAGNIGLRSNKAKTQPSAICQKGRERHRTHFGVSASHHITDTNTFASEAVDVAER